MKKEETTIDDENTFIHGIFLRELSHRFLAEVEVEGEVETCYVPSSCRLSPFIDLEGRDTLLLRTKQKNARTRYSVYAVKDGVNYILLNLERCNVIIEKELHRRYFSFLGKRSKVSREKKISGYKADLFIEDTNTLVEIKSILSCQSEAMFPSMYSKRSLTQLEKLSSLLEQGYSACYIFVSVNPKTKKLRIDETNEEYCKLFRACIDKGMNCCGVALSQKEGSAIVRGKLKVNL